MCHRPLAFALTRLLAGCSTSLVRRSSPGARIQRGPECARLDPSFETIVVNGRWHGRDVPIQVDTGVHSGFDRGIDNSRLDRASRRERSLRGRIGRLEGECSLRRARTVDWHSSAVTSRVDTIEDDTCWLF